MGDPVKLASRCVQSYHWSETFALRAVNEYKRFMRLKSDAVREVELALLPSSCVELVWLLELQDTREYQLNRGTCSAAALPPVCARVVYTLCLFCGVAGCDQARTFIHHDVAVISEELREAQYATTLELYWRGFRSIPPPDIWPPITYPSACDLRQPMLGRKRSRPSLDSSGKRKQMRVRKHFVCVC